jgi:eukaryotic-like serine/threonine-protein kinase
MMDHTNIAKVLDAGTTDTGRPYFVMELVRGIRITDYCDENKLNTDRRLDLFIHVCHAVQHAHQKGIIHRDLKPSNILVTINDGVPVPKVIDFGIAKATEGRLTDKTIYTQLHQFIGTPAYMSPEQAMMTSLDIDTRSDIYSLGVLLYELLTGRPPFDPRAMMAAGLDELRRTIREQEPARPSTRLSSLPLDALTTAAKRRSTEAPKLIHAISGDLDWIVMKCLEKDRTRRYDTANGLAADLKRHLNSEPINARPPSALYTFQKLVRRNKVVFAAASAVAAAVVIGLGVSTTLFLKERQSRRRAVSAERTATTEAQRATTAAEETRQRLLRLRLDNGARLLETAYLMPSLPWFVEAFKVDQGHPEHETKHRLRLASILQQCPRPRQMWFHGGSANVALSPDGKLALTGASDGTSAIWDVATGRQLGIAQFPRGTSSRPRCRFSTDGKSAFAEGGSAVVIWELGATPRARIISAGELIHTSAMSADGRFYVMGTATRPLLIWEAETGNLTEVSSTVSDKADVIAFLPPNARSVLGIDVPTATPVFLTVDRVGYVRAWDAATTNVLFQQKLPENVHASLVAKGEFSPDGRFLLQLQNAYRDFKMLLWDVPTGQLIAELKHDHHVLDIAFSPDGKTVVTSSQDRTARIWDTHTGKLRGAPLQHERYVSRVRISPGGQLILTVSADGTARVWDLHTGKSAGPPLVHSAATEDAVFGADDATIATGCVDGTVRIWDLAAAPKWRWVGAQASFTLSFTPREVGFNDPSWGAALIESEGIHVLGLQDEPTRLVRLPPGTIGFAAGSRDGKRLLVGRQNNQRFEYQLWATETSQPLGPAFSTEVADYLFQRAASADCSRFVTTSSDKKSQVWDTLTGQRVGSPIQLPETKDEFTVELSPDGTAITAIIRNRLHVWEASDGRERFAALENMSASRLVSFSSDSQRLATACKDGSGKDSFRCGMPGPVRRWGRGWCSKRRFSPSRSVRMENEL